MTSVSKNTKDYNYYLIMCMIDDNQLLTYRTISKSISVSTGSAFNLMTDLIKNGCVNVEILDKKKIRPRYAYHLSSVGVRQKAILARVFLDLKQAELVELQKELIKLKEDVGYVPKN